MARKDELRMAGIILGGCVGSVAGPEGTFLGALTGFVIADIEAKGQKSRLRGIESSIKYY